MEIPVKSLSSYGSQGERATIFAEAFSVLSRAMAIEVDNARVTIHPFSNLLTGTARFLERGDSLTMEQHDAISRYVAEARYRYGGDAGVAAAVARLDSLPALRLRYVVAHLLLEAVEAKLVSTPSRGGREVGPECAR